jgi:hypothetical protein
MVFARLMRRSGRCPCIPPRVCEVQWQWLGRGTDHQKEILREADEREAIAILNVRPMPDRRRHLGYSGQASLDVRECTFDNKHLFDSHGLEISSVERKTQYLYLAEQPTGR